MRRIYEPDGDGGWELTRAAELDIEAMREEIAEDEDRDPDDISDDECVEALEEVADYQFQAGGGSSRWLNC